jgi:hypothetical protein
MEYKAAHNFPRLDGLVDGSACNSSDIDDPSRFPRSVRPSAGANKLVAQAQATGVHNTPPNRRGVNRPVRKWMERLLTRTTKPSIPRDSRDWDWPNSRVGGILGAVIFRQRLSMAIFLVWARDTRSLRGEVPWNSQIVNCITDTRSRSRSIPARLSLAMFKENCQHFCDLHLVSPMAVMVCC